MRSHLVILGERNAIAWVLANRQMAITADRAAGTAGRVEEGDELFLYQTRDAFHNPTRHRGRIMGLAVATEAVHELATPVEVAEREFSHGFRFELQSLARPHEGPDLSLLIPRLRSFPNKTGWATSLRRPLMTLDPADVLLIKGKLRPADDVDAAIAEYVAQVR